MTAVDVDELMAVLLASAAADDDGLLLASHVHGGTAKVWRAPAMARLCSAGLFEFRERPVLHYALTPAGRVVYAELVASWALQGRVGA